MREAHRPAGQRGVIAFAIALSLACLIGIAALTVLPTSAGQASARERRTAEALAQAKQALIGYAIRGTPTAQGRPGDLPCPDLNNDGSADAVPGCSSAGARLGRLPWRTLGLPDLRDGDGERLWYAVSVNYKDNPRSGCASAGAPQCLNSDTPGTITVRSRDGRIVHDGSEPARGNQRLPTGAVAVVISPGSVLTRLGSAAAQDRGCTRGSALDSTCVTRDGQCSGTTPAAYVQTARCNPINYLDVIAPPVQSVTGAIGSLEDNATFIDGSSGDGFISGDVLDSDGRPVVNDRILALTYAELMPLLEQRVAREVLTCLAAYAAANHGKYPYPARPDDISQFSDQPALHFGHVPDQRFSRTRLVNPGLSDEWPDACGIKLKGVPPAPSVNQPWWTNWKDLVFFGMASNLDADATVSDTRCNPLSTCLTVIPSSLAQDKNLVVVLARRSLPGQARATTSAPTAVLRDYLEGANALVDRVFSQSPPSSDFNDLVLWQ